MKWQPFLCLSGLMVSAFRKLRSFITKKIPAIAKEEWNPRLRGKTKNRLVYLTILKEKSRGHYVL